MRATSTRERPRSARRARLRPRRGGAAAAGHIVGEGRRTLEQVVLDAFDGLVSAGSATCPVCSSDRLEPSGCRGCGSRLT